MKNIYKFGFTVLALPLLLSGCSASHVGAHGDGHGHADSSFSVGEPGSGHPDRVIKVSMLDTMRFEFTPALNTIADGETIEFHVVNDGIIMHEFSIGDAQDQIKHARAMKDMMVSGDTSMSHRDPNTVAHEPGKSGKLSWKFIGADNNVVFACNIPGHFEAGMHHKVDING